MLKHGKILVVTKRQVDVHVGMSLPIHVYRKHMGMVMKLISGIAFGGVIVYANVKGTTPLRP